ncbi:PROTEIN DETOXIFICATION 46 CHLOROPLASTIC [Salix koriyanagi]|uniref:PROTEIN DETOXIFICATION 46 CHLOROPLASTIC n=1 Tax=Salix koriyanagi TaxID=2511006 RepID=A0A9Q0TS87_9ROSI|nr:PROTEIN DETOXIFICATION 46 CHLOROPLASTIC [Salix koriyanagi]
MSLIDTVVIGQGSYIELAALGPATVLCDYMSYVFMFLSIATSNMVATYLARGLDGETRGLLMVVKLTLEVIGNLWFVGSQDKNQVQHQISILLFVGMTCGLLMLVFTRFFGSWALTAFSGPKNAQILPAANTYVQIRGLAWPAVLVGWVAQSASLGMKDSWGPLKALAVSSAVNGVGDVVLCSFLGYGIAGAAWATMVSQVIAGYMMIEALNKKGYNAFAISVPTLDEILTIIGLAAPVFVTMISKVAFYSLMIYFATSMGTHSVAAHQVMLQIMGMCTVMGEPLSQTAQSFMPELIYGVNRSLKKARRLLKSLVTIGSTMGLLLGTIGTFAPWLFPNIFTRDQKVIQEMYKVLLPFFMAIAVTPSIHCLEGTLLVPDSPPGVNQVPLGPFTDVSGTFAGRDLRFLSFSMTGCFSLGTVALMLFSSRGYGLPGCWYALVGFQWARFFLSLRRLLSLDGVLFSEDLSRYEMEKLKMHKVLIPYFIALITLKGIAEEPGQSDIASWSRDYVYMQAGRDLKFTSLMLCILGLSSLMVEFYSLVRLYLSNKILWIFHESPINVIFSFLMLLSSVAKIPFLLEINKKTKRIALCLFVVGGHENSKPPRPELLLVALTALSMPPEITPKSAYAAR